MANFNKIWKNVSPKGLGVTELRRSIAAVTKHLSIVDGVNIRPGADIDTDLILLHVTGKPTLYWDESENQLVFDVGARFEDGGSGDPLEVVQSQDTESFVRFKGISASGNVAKSIVDNGDVGGSTLKGWLQVFVEDLGDQILDQKYYIPIYTITT